MDDRFRIHNLTETGFEKLVTLICREVLGSAVTSFAKGRDGGKDAKFEGTANAFPSKVAPAKGKFIIQAKHTTFPASCSDYTFKTKIINEEIPRIKSQFDEGRLTHYLIFTNRRKTGGAEDSIPDRIRSETGVEHVWLRALEDIERDLSLYPEIVKAVGLDKLRSPIQFMPDDIRDVVVALHTHRQAVRQAFDSEHDFHDYPGLNKKNKINGLTPIYHKHIRDDSMKHFSDIHRFLVNTRNQTLAEQYHAVANDLKGQIILHRDRFDSFDHVLENIYCIVYQQSSELQQPPKRLLTKTIIHYMYVNCDIGEKE